ncbi:F-type H+-transporting ATPase subunit b [Desulfonatronum thiosulfatophilum]|uniref:ATP synthase subunit b n=1 Tax=Desulfonatronum thiosulfatophilum TaxID=617002 RepID=A0A1G6C314_9BACT|nr:F0F1 ATP synthase subunit B [Desulfonatronum thiosulfatophilum]SDB27275.1 F-type H+-transporting ATPase subunit b [Desulfonatronum thiosulfatophilum]
MKRIAIFLIMVIMVLVSAGLAWSAAEAGDMAKWRDFMWRVINFIIFVAILYWAAGKRIGKLLSDRREKIRDELVELDERRTEADKKLQEVEAQIKDLGTQREKVLADFQQQGEALKQAIIAQAHEKAALIKAQAESSATQEYKLATDKLREELADMVIEAAEKMIQGQLTKEGHEKLIQQSLTRVVLH